VAQIMSTWIWGVNLASGDTSHTIRSLQVSVYFQATFSANSSQMSRAIQFELINLRINYNSFGWLSINVYKMRLDLCHQRKQQLGVGKFMKSLQVLKTRDRMFMC